MTNSDKLIKKGQNPSIYLAGIIYLASSTLLRVWVDRDALAVLPMRGVIQDVPALTTNCTDDGRRNSLRPAGSTDGDLDRDTHIEEMSTL